jgi:hypothetical protein
MEDPCRLCRTAGIADLVDLAREASRLTTGQLVFGGCKGNHIEALE